MHVVLVLISVTGPANQMFCSTLFWPTHFLVVLLFLFPYINQQIFLLYICIVVFLHAHASSESHQTSIHSSDLLTHISGLRRACLFCHFPTIILLLVIPTHYYLAQRWQILLCWSIHYTKTPCDKTCKPCHAKIL